MQNTDTDETVIDVYPDYGAVVHAAGVALIPAGLVAAWAAWAEHVVILWIALAVAGLLFVVAALALAKEARS